MKIFILLSSIFFCTHCKSQSAIEIKYDRIPLSLVEMIKNNPNMRMTPLKMRMIVNDSFSFTFCKKIPKALWLNKKQVGDKLVKYATFCDLISGERFSEIDWPRTCTLYGLPAPDSELLPKKPVIKRKTGYKYIVKDSAIVRNWQFPDTQKIILKKVCYPALSVDKDNDSVLVWFTRELPFQKGSLWYDDLPGLALEVLDQKRNMYIKAIRIKEKNIRILPPQEGEKISAQEWIAIRKTIPVVTDYGQATRISIH